MERYSLVPKHHNQYVIIHSHCLANPDIRRYSAHHPQGSPLLILAYEAGCQGIVLSNHGGLQLVTSRSGIENLIDIVAALKTKGPWPNTNFAVFVDGGVRHASDVLKAIALGVGVGRGVLYAFSSYGQEGVERASEILRDEFAMNMQLIAARTISEIVPEMVDASALRPHAGLTPADNLYNAICKWHSFWSSLGRSTTLILVRSSITRLGCFQECEAINLYGARSRSCTL
jgi:hypothetical protein